MWDLQDGMLLLQLLLHPPGAFVHVVCLPVFDVVVVVILVIVTVVVLVVVVLVVGVIDDVTVISLSIVIAVQSVAWGLAFASGSEEEGGIRSCRWPRRSWRQGDGLSPPADTAAAAAAATSAVAFLAIALAFFLVVVIILIKIHVFLFFCFLFLFLFCCCCCSAGLTARRKWGSVRSGVRGGGLFKVLIDHSLLADGGRCSFEGGHSLSVC
mmetsp:Transcript_57891/g.126877  ORF Transcript_57891/g.126877 Transcript_57891/m.126877 type:complete len:211 (+) Transcript_57891:500-1132(+)